MGSIDLLKIQCQIHVWCLHSDLRGVGFGQGLQCIDQKGVIKLLCWLWAYHVLCFEFLLIIFRSVFLWLTIFFFIFDLIFYSKGVLLAAVKWNRLIHIMQFQILSVLHIVWIPFLQGCLNFRKVIKGRGSIEGEQVLLFISDVWILYQ